ncbi:Bro-N domain-containing protein [uncultured Agathobaculum sp.]|uniref:BRO-N domain-containing protein n=1 Tax=uncultured Agathobaculum sp. TaxID=2048140 RepID=UPI00296E616B
MSNEIQIFANDQFGEVRTLTKDGEPWFVGKDVAEILGYANSRKAIADHVDAEDKTDGVTIRDSIGRDQTPVLINESGLYSLILSSKLPTARAFKRWVTSEVLPAIRKHGEYAVPKVSQKRLGEVNSAARIIRQTLKEAGMAPQFVAVAMKSLYAPVGVEIPLEGVTLNKQLFDATAIAKQLGVLSRSGRPHAHAISAIIAQVDVLPEEKELAPFQSAVSGHAGTNVQYTKSVVAKVSLWLERHDYPESFEYRGKKYTLRYSAAA